MMHRTMALSVVDADDDDDYGAADGAVGGVHVVGPHDRWSD